LPDVKLRIPEINDGDKQPTAKRILDENADSRRLQRRLCTSDCSDNRLHAGRTNSNVNLSKLQGASFTALVGKPSASSLNAR